MRGGAHSDLTMTDDGLYVCKWKHNPQHRRILLNEALAACLLHALGVTVPHWAPVIFEDAGPELHFGTRFCGASDGTGIYDFIPYSLLRRVQNLDEFVTVLVFDLWVDNADGRQAVFTRASGSRFAATMIDNGFAFGFDGQEWRMRDRIVGKLYPGLSQFYASSASTALFEAAVTRVQEMIAAGLRRFLDPIPAEWVENPADMTRLLQRLEKRAQRLPDLVHEARASARAQ
jgi:hypothetical protein